MEFIFTALAATTLTAIALCLTPRPTSPGDVKPTRRRPF
jgi:hypothetical protein